MEATLRTGRKLLIITLMAACYAMMFIDMSGVAVILPKMQQQLNLSNIAIEWVMNSYLLIMAILLLLGGKLADYHGLRKIFNLGIGVFIVASVVCTVAQGIWGMMIGRILQGVGASMIMPTIVVLIHNHFPRNEYGKAFGTILIFSNFCYAIAPFLAGLFTEYLSWRIIFGINLPIGLLCLYLSYRVLDQDVIQNKPSTFDIKGAITFMLGISGLVIVIMQGGEFGWLNPWIMTTFIFSLIFLLAFIKIELNTNEPFLQIDLFRNKIFMSGNIIMSCGYICFAAVVFFPLWMHRVFEFSPIMLGFAMIPVTIPTVFIPRLSGAWRDHSGPFMPMLVGTVITALGVLWMAVTAPFQNYWLIFIGLFAYGLGLPMFVPNCVMTIMTAVSEGHRSVAAGVFSTLRQVALSLGFALMALVITGYDNWAIGKTLTSTPEYKGISISLVKSLAIGEGVTTHLDTTQIKMLKQMALAHYSQAFSISMFVMSIFTIIAIISTLLYIPKK